MVRLIDDERLFKNDPSRKSILPVIYKEVWNRYKNLQAATWTAEEVDFKTDIAQISNGEVSKDVLRIVEYVLGFFSGADNIVNENLAENFLKTIKILEAQFFYGMQIQNENVHNETYSKTIEVYYKDDPDKKDALFNAVSTMPCIKKLFDWCEKWIRRTPEQELEENQILQDYAENGADEELVEDLAYIWCTAKQLIAFACVEGIMFSGAFCIIFWIKELGLLPGLTFSNELISTDEGLHRDFAILMYSMIEHQPPSEQVIDIIKEAVDFQKAFVGEMLIKPLTGMNVDLMTQYVMFAADNLSANLINKKVYNAVNPFPFMDKISFNGVTNFFEKRVGEYSMAGFEADSENNEIVLNDDY